MIWFVLSDGEVKGPLNQDSVLNHIRGGSDLIWGPQIDSWISADEWSRSTNNHTSITAAPQATQASQVTEAPQVAKASQAVEDPAPSNLVAESHELEEFDHQDFKDFSHSEETQTHHSQIDLESEGVMPVSHITTSTKPARIKKPKTTELEWFYAVNKKPYGPYTQIQLVTKIRQLDFSAQVYVWNKNLKDWSKLENFPELISEVTNFAA